jgi:general secretion pathway protein N
VLNRWSWVALGVGAYVAFTLSSFPAGTAYAWFAPQGASFSGIEGTLWSGRAAAGAVGDLALRDIRWRVRPTRLLIGRLAAEIEARLTDGFVSANVSASPTRVALSEVRASTSIPALRGVLPVSGVRGDASVNLDELELRGGVLTTLLGELRLAKLEVAPFVPTGSRDLLPIGDYTVRFLDSAGNGINASFVDSGGPLEVSGTLLVDAQRAYTLDGLIKARPDASQQLVEGLSIITADPDNEGRRRLTLTGSL